MAKQDSTPDLMAELLGGADFTSKTQRGKEVNTQNTTPQNATPQEAPPQEAPRQKAKRNAAKRKAVKRTAVKRPATEQGNDRAKYTFYLTEETANALERAWLELRLAAPLAVRASIGKSDIADAALAFALTDYAERGQSSALAQAFNQGGGDD